MNSRCVSCFNLPAFLQPSLFHYHRSPRFYHHASGHSKEISHKPKSVMPHRTTPFLLLLIDPLTVHASIAPIDIHARGSRAHCERQKVCWRLRLPPCTQASEEQDDGDVLLIPVCSVSRELAHKFDGAHLFACHTGALIPANR